MIYSRAHISGPIWGPFEGELSSPNDDNRGHPTVPEGNMHRVTTPGKTSGNPVDPCRTPRRPRRDLRRALGETPAEVSKNPFERQISLPESA